MSKRRSSKKTHQKVADVSSTPKPRGLPSAVSRIRLSLTFRIAIHFSFELLRSFLPVFLLVTLLFSFGTLSFLEHDISRLKITPLLSDGTLPLSTLDDVTCTMSPEFRSDGISMGRGAYRILSPLSILTDFRFIVLAQHMSGQTMMLTFSLKEPMMLYFYTILALMLGDLYRMFYFIWHRKRLHHSVLAPIRDITDMAATLSANNLSNRINIAGTKNELKDLATVINSMLDRIETSYNSQKQFVSDASHELRTPIAVIQGYVSMLSRWGKSDPEILDEGITAIAQETKSMKELVESLLFLARHDKKTLLMEMTRFDMLDVASEVQREAAMVTPEDTFLLSPSDHVEIKADRNMMKQVMRILCDNAVKYSPKGGSITIGVQKTATGCTLSMSDNGPGIPKEELSKIFERFYRSDSARKAEGGGHGLGLSIARIIVMGHKGQLRVRSKVGAGTTFFVDLPLVQEPAAPAPETPAPPDKKKLRFHRRRPQTDENGYAEQKVS